MRLCLMQLGGSGLTTYLPNELSTTDHVLAGLRLSAVRAFFNKHGSLGLQIIAPDGVSVLKRGDAADLPDFMAWSWLPVLSGRARDLALELGCRPADFFPCVIDIEPASSFFIHVPEALNDVIDFERSTFDVEPTERSPVPFGLNQLAIKPGVRSKHLQPCWRPMMASPDHMASELIAREDFVEAWTARGFTGASFRCIAECESEH